MIPILYSKNETAFTTNGIGRLVDCISCKVTEERNGIYECEFQYPVSGKWFKEMSVNGGIIGVIHDDNHDIQPFDIYSSSASINGVVTFYARHISYRLNNVILEPFTASGVVAAVAGISTHSVTNNPFMFSTDKTTEGSFEIDQPRSVKSILFGREGSLVDVFGTAEWKFDKFNAYMLSQRGSDTGVTVRYGKNMVGFERVTDDGETFNAVAPYWTDGENYVYPSEIIVQPTIPVTPVKVVEMDFSQKFESQPTAAQVRDAARAYLDSNQPWIPSDNIKVNFIALWQSSEYENVAEIQRVGLCDTVSIYWTDLGVVAEKAKVVRVSYDVLAERLDEIEIGTIEHSHVAIDNGTNNMSPSGISGDSSADKVVEVGSSGIWTYRKWGSGIAECWGSREVTVDNTATWQSPIQYYATLVQETFPSGLFISPPNCIPAVGGISGQSGGDFWYSDSGSTPVTASKTQGVYLVRAGSVSNKKAVVYWDAKGRWK